MFLVLLTGSIATYSQSPWPPITSATKPWTRWWWMGSAVDEQNISQQLKQYSTNGLGGVEIVPIYGAKGYESSYISYLSKRWMQVLDHTVKAADSLKMGVNISVGSGWPIGGPQVTIEDAATRLVIQSYTLSSATPFNQKIVINDPKQTGLPGTGISALMAYNDKNESIDITDKVSADGSLTWAPLAGDWKLYAAFITKTRQQVKRAAPGGQGYTLDHFSGKAIEHYFSKIDSVFGNSSHGVHAFYNDSYEVFNANWTADFFREFKQRRGYDLKPYIRYFSDSDSSDLTAKLKSDYRETISDLMLDYFTKTFREWSNKKNSLALNQAHGSPGNLLDLYAGIDIPETETFGSTEFNITGLKRDTNETTHADPDFYMFKFASSAAHTTNKPLTSSETFTWLTEHFKTSLSQCKPELDQLFLAGVNHVFYHGTTYSPATATWPGWLFYASVNMVPANSIWPHSKAMNEYIARCQSVLQSGKPNNEILLYWPIYDLWQNPKDLDMPFRAHNLPQWLYPTSFYRSAKSLRGYGYSFDYVSDKMLQEATYTDSSIFIKNGAPGYRVIVVPSCKHMPLQTFQALVQLAEKGATIIMQEFPDEVPGMFREKETKDLTKTISNFTIELKSKGVSEIKRGKGRIMICEKILNALRYTGLQGEELSLSQLLFIRRKTDTGKYYFIANHQSKTFDTTIMLRTRERYVTIMDPLTGKFGSVQPTISNDGLSFRLQLKSGASIIIQTSSVNNNGLATWLYEKEKEAATDISTNWQVRFTTGGPLLPATRKLANISTWTSWNDSIADRFSGSAVYTKTIKVKKTSSRYLLKLGNVYESARVRVNGKEAGIAWTVPFELEIGSFLKNGNNTIEIEVSNLMANRIRYMDQKKIPWRNYHEINFVNVQYNPFDASSWQIAPSGLAGPVLLQPLSNN